MNARMRFDNPMLGDLARRRSGGFRSAGRVEWRPFGASGVIVANRLASVQAHHHVSVNRYTLAPVLRIAIHRPTAVLGRDGKSRIETRIVREPGQVRDLLRDNARFTQAPGSEPGSLRNDSQPHRHLPASPVTTTSTRVLRDLADATVERVIRHRQRIESGRDSTVVMRERRALSADVERALKSVTPHAPDPTRAGEPARFDQPGTAPMTTLPDLDRLTDQIVSRIDDRLIAHRERMGTLF